MKQAKIQFNNNLRKFRFEHNEISQQELANQVGVTRLTIHSIEKGKFVPSALLALKIARFFNQSFEDVFFIVDDEWTFADHFLAWRSNHKIKHENQ